MKKKKIINVEEQTWREIKAYAILRGLRLEDLIQNILSKFLKENK